MKYNLDYVVRPVKAPGEEEFSLIPVIVNRIPSRSLIAVINNALKNNLIAGLQDSAVKSIADGLADQIYDTLKDGRGVRFGSYFYVRPYLTGQCDANGTLAKKVNGIEATITAGPDFGLTIDDFSLHFAGAETQPRIDFVTYNADLAERGEVKKGCKALVNGRLLVVSESDDAKVTFTDAADAAAKFEVTSFDKKGAEMLEFAAPDGLVAGHTYAVEVSRTDDAGNLRVSNTKSVKVLAGDTPSTAPVVESAYPIDHQDDTEHIREAEAFVIDGRNFGSTSLKYQYKHGEDGWSGLSEPLDGDEEYHRNEENTEIEVFRQTVNGILADNELDTGDLVKFVITNSDGSASVQRTVQLV